MMNTESCLVNLCSDDSIIWSATKIKSWNIPHRPVPPHWRSLCCWYHCCLVLQTTSTAPVCWWLTLEAAASHGSCLCCLSSSDRDCTTHVPAPHSVTLCSDYNALVIVRGAECEVVWWRHWCDTGDCDISQCWSRSGVTPHYPGHPWRQTPVERCWPQSHMLLRSVSGLPSVVQSPLRFADIINPPTSILA